VTLRAEAFAAIHRGVPGDIHHYREQCRGAHSVLELGAGYGRVLIRLENPEILGLEQDPELLAAAQRACSHIAAQEARSVSVAQGDMINFALGRRFDRVIIPFNGLLCLTTEQKRACMGCVRRHLSEDGRLCFDVYDFEPDAEDLAAPEPCADGPEFLVELELDGQRYRVFESSSYWWSEQRIDVRHVFTSVHSEEKLSLNITHHYLLRTQLAPLLNESGFEHVQIGQVGNTEQVAVTAW
jgi:SAM-dependent methyltransferase